VGTPCVIWALITVKDDLKELGIELNIHTDRFTVSCPSKLAMPIIKMKKTVKKKHKNMEDEDQTNFLSLNRFWS